MMFWFWSPNVICDGGTGHDIVVEVVMFASGGMAKLIDEAAPVWRDLPYQFEGICTELEILRNRGRGSTHRSVVATWPKSYSDPRRLSKPLRSCGWPSRCHAVLLCFVGQWSSWCDNGLDAVASKSHAARGHFHTSACLRFGEHLWQAR